MLVLQDSGAACHLDMRFAAGQLAWLSARPAADAAADATAPAPQPAQQDDIPPAAGAAAAAPAAAACGGGGLGLAQLFAGLAAEHAAVSLPAAAVEPQAAAAAAGGQRSLPGVWVHGGAALQEVVTAVLRHLGQGFTT